MVDNQNNSAESEFMLPDESELSSRTRVPTDQLGSYLSLSEHRLRQEVEAVTTILKRFAKAVADVSTEPRDANSFLRDLDLKSISQDHDWRKIFSALKSNHEHNDEYKKTVLVKYLQFLSFRKRLFEFVHARKTGLEETATISRSAIFSATNSGMRNKGEWVQIPIGEALPVSLDKQDNIRLRLARYRVFIEKGNPAILIDENEVRHALKTGRNIIGRHPESDIVIAAGSAAISRAHLIIEYNPPNKLILMDLSTGGTFISSRCITNIQKHMLTTGALGK